MIVENRKRMEEEFFCFCSGEQNEKGSVIVFVNEGGGPI